MSNRVSPSRKCLTRVAAALVVLLLASHSAEAQSLRGSSGSLDRQNAQARAHDFTYLRTPEQARTFVDQGHLVPVPPNGSLDIHQVSFPYARPELRVFLERLGAQFQVACGEKLVVTSLTRPTSTQPANASSRSVHPTGMAADLRRPDSMNCRRWLESTLLTLEGEGVLEAIYERNPPHYHLALFPDPYAGYLARMTGNPDIVAETLADAPVLEAHWVTHAVARGETLWTIADRYGASMARIRAENGIRNDRLFVGQRLSIPVYQTVPGTPEVVRVATATEEDLGQARIVAVAEPDRSEPAAGGSTRTHTVSAGESLWTIGRAYGVSENALRAANGIQGSRIFVGQTIRIPPEDQSGESVLRYTVQRGESLWVIATRHGTTVDAIRQRNGMDTTRIYAGQVLDVPLRF